MLGYVQIYKPDLKVREYEIYKGYYCGICKYIGRTFGNIPRVALSYDAAFLAILLASASEEPDRPVAEHCIAHHIKNRPVIQNEAIAYAGDVMLILAWHKLMDDARDDKSAKAKALMLLLKKHYSNLYHKHSRLCKEIENQLEELHKIEDAKAPSLDQAAEPFALIMRALFSHGATLIYKQCMDAEDFANLHESFANIGYHMGKWIYLMDAVDDIGENIQNGAYNPLIYRFDYDKGESAEDFRDRIKANLEFNLFHYLSVVGQQIENFEMKKNKGIIDNIVFFGLNRKTEEILAGKKENENESI